MAHIHKDIDLTVSAYIVHDQRVLLVFHKGLQKWLPVGGHVELHEDTDEAIEREIREESGLTVEMIGTSYPQLSEGNKPLRTPEFVNIHQVTDTHRHLDLAYFAKAHTNKVTLSEKEHTDIRWFSAEDLRNPAYRIIPYVLFCCEHALKKVG